MTLREPDCQPGTSDRIRWRVFRLIRIAGRVTGAAFIAAAAAGPLFVLFWGVGHATLELVRPMCRVCTDTVGFMDPFPEVPVSDLVAAIFMAIILAPFAIIVSVALAGPPALIAVTVLACLGRWTAFFTRRIAYASLGLVVGAALGTPSSYQMQALPWTYVPVLGSISGAVTGAVCAIVAHRLFHGRSKSSAGS